MAETRRGVVIRLSTEGVETVKNALKLLGKDGEDALRRIERASRGVSPALGTLDAAVARVHKSLTRLFTVGAIVYGARRAGQSIKQLTQDFSDLVDQSRKTGIGVEALQELEYAAKTSSVPVEQLDRALIKFRQNMSDAARGEQSDFLRTLQANNIALRDQAGNLRSPQALLRDYANLVKNAANEGDRLNLVNAAFGKGMDELVILLRNGADGLDRAADARRRLGPLATQQEAEMLKQINDEWEKMAHTLEYGVKAQLISVVGWIKETGEWLRKTFPQGSYSTDSRGRVMSGEAAETAARADRDFGFRLPSTVADLATSLNLDSFGKGATKLAPATPDRGAEKEQKRLERIAEIWLEKVNPAAAAYNTYQEALADLGAARERGLLSAADYTRALTEAQKEYNEALVAARLKQADINAELIKSDLRGFIRDWRESKSAIDAAANALDRFATRLLDMAVNNLVDAALGGLTQSGAAGGSNFLTTILSSLFGGGKAGGGPLDQGKWYVAGERGPEPIWGGGPGAFAMGYPSPQSSAAAPRVNIVTNIDARGAGPDVAQRLRSELDRRDRMIEASIPRWVNQAYRDRKLK